mgnify:CR=1 FL=1
MKKSIIIILFLKIIFYNKIAIGDIFFDLDLLPIDKQANIIKINFSKSSKLFSENLNTSKNISSNKFNVGFNFGKKRNLFYDLDVNDNDFNSKFKLNNYQQKNYKTKITLIYPFNNFGESEIIRGVSFRFGMEDTNQFLCLESNLSVYGISNTNCNLPGKTFHQFEQDDRKGFILSYNRKIFGIDTFIKKVDYNWLGKNSFSLGINSSLVQNDLRLNKQLVFDHPNVKNIVPQSQDWIKITLNPKYSLTRKLGKGWSFGNSYNLFMTNNTSVSDLITINFINFFIFCVVSSFFSPR